MIAVLSRQELADKLLPLIEQQFIAWRDAEAFTGLDGEKIKRFLKTPGATSRVTQARLSAFVHALDKGSVKIRRKTVKSDCIGFDRAHADQAAVIHQFVAERDKTRDIMEDRKHRFTKVREWAAKERASVPPHLLALFDEALYLMGQAIYYNAKRLPDLPRNYSRVILEGYVAIMEYQCKCAMLKRHREFFAQPLRRVCDGWSFRDWEKYLYDHEKYRKRFRPKAA